MQYRFWRTITIILLTLIPATLALAEEEINPYQSFIHLIPEISDFTGAATQQIPISVPPGRAGMQPGLYFSYNSYQHNSWLGIGWQVHIDAIQRRTKYGVHYDRDEYDLVTNGMKSELVPIGNDQFRARIENDFTQYYYHRADDYWEVTRKDGTKLFFGAFANGATKQFNNHGTFKWHLSRVEDPNTNYMTIDYVYDQGRSYPFEIHYTGNENGAEATKRIRFEYDTERPDKQISYISKSAVWTAWRLKSIKTDTLYSGSAREYRLKYDTSPAGGASRLRKIRIFGYKEGNIAEIPGYTFSYQQGAQGQIEVKATIEDISLQNADPYFADINGDNRDDLILVSDTVRVYYSNGDGTFAQPAVETSPDSAPDLVKNDKEDDDAWAQHYFVDLNGDARSDLVQIAFKAHDCDSRVCDHTGKIIDYSRINTYLANQDGTFSAGSTLPGPVIHRTYLAFYDANGDRMIDILHTRDYVNKYSVVYYNDGQGYFSDSNSGYPSLPRSDIGQNTYTFADVNGDGLTDCLLYILEPAWYVNKKGRRIETYLADGTGQFHYIGKHHFIEMFPDHPDKADHIGKIASIDAMDVNNDSKADLVITATTADRTPFRLLFLSFGDGLLTPLTTPDGSQVAYQKIDIQKTHYADINGDNIPEPLGCIFKTHQDCHDHDKFGKICGPIVIDENHIEISLSTPPEPYDLMNMATTPASAQITYEYRRSDEDHAANNHFLPFTIYPVKKRIVADGIKEHPEINRYHYNGGYYDTAEREFRGFEHVTRTHADNTITKTQYYIGNAHYSMLGGDCYYLKGRIKQKEFFEPADGALLSTTFYIWHYIEDGSGQWAYVKPTLKHTTHYDDQTVVTETIYQYNDTNGNLERITTSGTNAPDIITELGWHNYRSEFEPLWRQTLEKIYHQHFADTPERHTTFEHDPNGNLRHKTLINYDPDQPDAVWTYEYHSNGNLSKTIDPNGNATTYAYDHLIQTFPIEITNALGHHIQKTWDYRNGLEKTITDPNHQTTTMDYDEFGRLIHTEFADGGFTSITYSDYCTDEQCTNVSLPREVLVQKRIQEAATQDTHIYFDGLARQIQSATSGPHDNWIIHTTHYDMMGRVIFEAGPFYQPTEQYINPYDYPSMKIAYVSTTYDQRGRPIVQESPDGQNGIAATRFSYSGFTTTITDPDMCRKTEKRDHLGRIIEVTEHADTDIHTLYKYNAAGDLTQVVIPIYANSTIDAPTGQSLDIIVDTYRTRITYDTLGRKTAIQDLNMGQWEYAYDTNGNLIEQTDARGIRTQFTYDALNRLIQKIYPDTNDPPVTYQYDNDQIPNGIGRLHQISNTAVTTTYQAYDPVGRITQQFKTINGTAARTSQWTYDYSGNLTRLTYPHTDALQAFYVDYHYHPGTSLIYTVTGSDTITYAQLTDYQPSAQIGHITFGNGVYTKYTHDPMSQRLTDIQTHATTSMPQNHQYRYTPAGDIEHIDDQAFNESYYYSYDQLHRLISETTSTGSIGVTPAILEMQYEHPEHLHAVSSVTHKGVTHHYEYDANGNQLSGPDLSDPMNIVQRTVTYNADNMPTQVTHSNGGTINLTYDGESVRAKKTGPNGDTYYFSNTFELINNTETFYIFAGNLRIAKKTTDTESIYFHKDHLGSSSAVTNADGEVIETARYMSFGGKRGEGGITVSAHKFNDQEHDAESGLYNYDARLYDPMVGRFASADSIVPDWYNPQALNRYSYCLNNPLKYSDPNGHEPQDAIDVWNDFITSSSSLQYGSFRQTAMWDTTIKPSGLPFTSKFQDRMLYQDSKGVDVKAYSDQDLAQEYLLEKQEQYEMMGILSGTLAGASPRTKIDAPLKAAKSVPSKAKDVLSKIKSNKGTAPKGYKGGRTFKNDGRGGGQQLRTTDSNGNSVTYREYDVNPYQKGVNRGAERIVRGSDGRSYYTSDHYKTFTRIE